jgi:ABC-type transport system involved in multi-copper enzyme maturation permease subunit
MPVMNTIWQSLLGKEWHEHKWKLVATTAVFCGVVLTAAALYEIDEVFGIAAALLSFCIVPMAFFVGLGAAAGERGARTMAFTQSLPVPMWRVAVAKLLVGTLTIVVPTLLTVAFIASWMGVVSLVNPELNQSEVRQLDAHSATGHWYLDCLLICSSLGISIFIWAAAGGVNRRDEVVAGGYAVGAIVGWWLLIFAFFVAFYSRTWPTLEAVLLATAPAGFIAAGPIAIAQAISLALVIITASVVHLLLAVSYVWRFGRTFPSDVPSPRAAIQAPSEAMWLSAPRMSPMAAIVWKQLRESRPLFLAGLAVIVGFVLLVTADFVWGSRRNEFNQLPVEIMKVSAATGIVLALLMGVGVSLNDTQPKINTFWRSRPVNPNQWFWMKFITGLVILIAAVYVPVAIGSVASRNHPTAAFNHPDLAVIFPLQLAIYAAAVATTILVRQAVYAAILSIAMVYVCVMLVLSPIVLSQGLRTGDWTWEQLQELSGSAIAISCLVSFGICTVLGWLAMRFDWGRKSAR